MPTIYTDWKEIQELINHASCIANIYDGELTDRINSLRCDIYKYIDRLNSYETT